MAGRNPSDAVDNYVGPLQQSLSCITDAVLRPNCRGRVLDKPCVLVLPNGPARLKGRRDLQIDFIQNYMIVEDDQPDAGPYRVTTNGYKYTLEDERGVEIIGYHFHPDGPSRIRYPHLHLGAAARIGCYELESTKAHLPTGRVFFEAFVQLLIEVFDVQARRPDHASKLEEIKERAIRFATWFQVPRK